MMNIYPSSSSSSSAHSASVRVEKATSEFLNGPDWTMNIDICDAINLNHWLAKDIVKALKKRLQHKNSHVHLLALTLLETMVKNCGEPVHSQIVERNILQDMIKIVKKKTNMSVREKILVLLDSWQQAFGGAGGKYPQYYWAYEELRRSGVEFPQRASDSALIFTPPVTHSTVGHAHAGYGMPSNSSTRLDEAMASEIETLSLSSISSMQEVLDLLSAMLQAVDPNDRLAIKDEVIVDLVDRCRSNHKKLMQMLTTTGDEELLAKGLELNDGIQNELAKHDAIAAGHPLPTQMSSKPQLTEVPISSPKVDEGSKFSSSPPAVPSAPSTVVINAVAEEEEEEDEFAQLARRHSKTQSATSQNTFVGASETEPSASNALVISDPPVPVKTTKEQDMIDFLSLALSTTGPSSHAPESSTQNMQQAPVSPSGQGSPYAPQTYTGNQGQVAFSSYVAPWAQPQPQIQQQTQLQQQQSQPQTQGQPQQAQYQAQVQSPQFSSGYPTGQPQQPQYQAKAQSSQFSPGYPPGHGQPQQPQYQTHGQPQQPQFQAKALSSQFSPGYPPGQGQPQQPQYQTHGQPQQPQFQGQPQQPQFQGQPQQPQFQTQGQPQQPQFQPQAQTSQYSSAYPPPPWAATPGYYTNPRQQLNPTAYRPMQGTGSSQQVNSAHGSYVAGDGQLSSRPTGNATAVGQKSFIPSYRLFEDLNVLGNGDGRSKTNSASPSLSGTTQSMGGGWK